MIIISPKSTLKTMDRFTFMVQKINSKSPKA